MPIGRLLALLALSSAPAMAQRYADLIGRILDPSEGGIADASVTVVNQETGFRRVTRSEDGGSYSVSSLQPGLYQVTVRKENFHTVREFDVRLAAASVTHADFMLPVGSVEESITIVGNPPVSERQDASTGSRIDRDEFERLPLGERGMLSLLEFAPGTNVVPATRGDAGQFTATGQRPNTNYFTVDGVSANTGVSAGGVPAQSTGGALPALSAFGSLDSLISLDAVAEFRVTTSTSVAEFGRLPGAAVALNSRSGTNELHGSASYRIRNEIANANDWFANQAGYARLPLRLQDVAATLGGPVKRNRTFFFLSYQGMWLRQPAVWLQPVPSLEARQNGASWAQPLLDLFPPPAAGPVASGIAETVTTNDRPASLNVGGIRIDQAIGSRVSFFGRYNDAPSTNEFGTLATNQLDLRSQNLTLGLNARPKTSIVLDLHANESQANAHSVWNIGDGSDCPLGPLVTTFRPAEPAPCSELVRFNIAGVGQLITGREGDRRQRQFQVLQTGAWHRRTNTLSLGADYRRIFAVRRDPGGTFGLIADNVDDLTGTRNLWVAQSAAQNLSTELHELSLWVQDTWQAGSRLTVASGLRWEYSPAPTPSAGVYVLDPKLNTVFSTRQELWPPSYHNFAPRLGLALRLTRSGNTILRAGGGLYYDSSVSIATDFLNSGPFGIEQFTSAINGLFSTQLTYGFMPNLRLPQIRQWNVSLERALSPHDVLSLGYVGAAGRYLLRREIGGAAYTPTSLVALTTNNAWSRYDALDAQYRRRLAAGLQALAAYSWSHSIDNDSSDAFLVWAGPGSVDRGSSDFDLRHSFTGSLTYEFSREGKPAQLSRLLGGWAIDGIFRARTGFPISVLTSEEFMGISLANSFRPDWVFGQPLWISDANAPGGRRLNPIAFHSLPPPEQGTLGRNSINGFGMSQFDLALRREFRLSERRRLQLRIEAFNAFNHPNFADPLRYLNSPVAGDSTSMLNVMLGTGSPGSGLTPILQTGGPRSLQGTLRFQF